MSAPTLGALIVVLIGVAYWFVQEIYLLPPVYFAVPLSPHDWVRG